MGPSALFAAATALAGDGAAEAALAIDAWFRSATPRAIVSLALEARAAFRQTVWRRYVPLNAPIDDASLEVFAPHARLAIAALLSVHRSGYLREAALRALAAAPDERVVPFLLLRTDDIVPSVRALAERATAARLQDELAPAFARSLGIVELLAARVRGGGGPLVRQIRDFLVRPEHRAALVVACRDEDATVRLAAHALRLRNEPLDEVLREALADDDLRVRRFAARAAAARTTSATDKRALLPLVTADRSPSIRIVGLRGWATVDDAEVAFEAALLDHNAAVRYVARTLLRARQPDRPFGKTRERALAALAAPGASTRELVGALGALSDVGLRADVACIRPFENDGRGAVRSEARRTLALLDV